MGNETRGGWCAWRRVRKPVLATLVAAVLAVNAGCYGHFPLTRTVYKLNGAVPTDTVKSLVFLVCVPVYGVAAVGDALVFNLVEFWTGAKITVVVVPDAPGAGAVVVRSGDGQWATSAVQRGT